MCLGRSVLNVLELSRVTRTFCTLLGERFLFSSEKSGLRINRIGAMIFVSYEAYMTPCQLHGIRIKRVMCHERHRVGKLMYVRFLAWIEHFMPPLCLPFITPSEKCY